MVSDAGLQLIREFEGLRLEAYPDPGTGGKPWTIGYGHTHGVHQGEKCTKEEAEIWLRQDAQEACMQALRAVKVRLTQNQLDALTSFVFNLGAANFKSSTLLRRLNDGDFAKAADEILRWNKAAGKVLPGLVRRREAERALFLKDEQVAPLLLPLAGALIDIFTPLAKEKITKEMARHTDSPEVAEQVANSVIQTAQVLTGQSDPVQAVAEVKKDPELVQQVEQKTLVTLDQVVSVYREVQTLDQAAIKSARDYNAQEQPILDTPWVKLKFIHVLSLMFCGFSGTFVTINWASLTPEMRGAVLMLMMIAGWNGVREYWMGSSSGSQEKTRELLKK